MNEVYIVGNEVILMLGSHIARFRLNILEQNYNVLVSIKNEGNTLEFRWTGEKWLKITFHFNNNELIKSPYLITFFERIILLSSICKNDKTFRFMFLNEQDLKNEIETINFEIEKSFNKSIN